MVLRSSEYLSENPELSVGGSLRRAREKLVLDFDQGGEASKLSNQLSSGIENTAARSSHLSYLIDNVVREYSVFLDLNSNYIRRFYWVGAEKDPGVDVTLSVATEDQRSRTRLRRLFFWLV